MPVYMLTKANKKRYILIYYDKMVKFMLNIKNFNVIIEDVKKLMR